MKRLSEILLSETSEIEFKQALEMKKPKSWLKTVSAFANGIGGCIYWGISDNHKVLGIPDAQAAIDRITAMIKAKIEPMLLYKIEVLEIDGKSVICLELKAGAATPYYYVNEGNRTAYIRSGNESIVAPAYILNELILKGQRLSF